MNDNDLTPLSFRLEELRDKRIQPLMHQAMEVYDKLAAIGLELHTLEDSSDTAKVKTFLEDAGKPAKQAYLNLLGAYCALKDDDD